MDSFFRASLLASELLARRVFHALLFPTTSPILVWCSHLSCANSSATFLTMILGGLFKNLFWIVLYYKASILRARDNLLLFTHKALIVCLWHVFHFWVSNLLLEYLLIVIFVVDRNQIIIWVISLVNATNLSILNRRHLDRWLCLYYLVLVKFTLGILHTFLDDFDVLINLHPEVQTQIVIKTITQEEIK